ncbi:MAG: signal peptidase I [Gammaproteobacteria bacterium]|jgi:signal peptidase I
MNFEKILVALTLLTGIFWLINKFGKFNKDSKLKDIVDYLGSFFVIFFVVLLLRTFLVEPYRIPSSSMKPTLVEGDFILVNKYKYGLRLPIIHKKILSIGKVNRGEIIIFWQESSKKILIKRVIGLPGDHIVYKDQNLYINNALIDMKDSGIAGHDAVSHRKTEILSQNVQHDIYVNPNNIRAYKFDNIVVGKDSYFVMGDNRDNSNDSRFWGLVSEQDILGKAFFTWFSFDWENKVFRFDRICTKIK